MLKFKEYLGTTGVRVGGIDTMKPMKSLGKTDRPPKREDAKKFQQKNWKDKGFGNFSEDRKLTKSDLDAVEKYADRLFAKIGLDVEFTRHFLDRVNDARNGKQITQAELTRLFKQSFNKHKKTFEKLPKDIEAVLNDIRTDINMPFVIKLDRNGELDMVAKTIMRKKNFSTSNKKYTVEEVEEYFSQPRTLGKPGYGPAHPLHPSNKPTLKTKLQHLLKKKEDTKRIPRKPGQKAGSDKHSDLYTDENPKGTIHGLGFTDAEKARQSVNKIKGSGKTHAHKIQAAIAMSQRAKVASERAKDPKKKKDLGAAHKVYQAYIDSIKKDK